MFSFIFPSLLFFVQHSPTTALKCFGGQPNAASPEDLAICEFQLKMSDTFPDMNQLVNVHKCQQHDSTPTGWNPSCYASASIDYSHRTITIILDAVQTQTSYKSRYKSSLGEYDFATRRNTHSLHSIVTASSLYSTIQIICRTSDDCAVEELKKILSKELTKTKQRMEIFKELIPILIKPKWTSKQSNLM